MAKSNPLNMQSLEQTLKITRMLWAGLMMGQLGFLIAAANILANQQHATSAQGPGILLFHIGIGMLLTCVPAGYFVRGQVYKKNWVEDRITPQGYLVGNLILWACCESVGIFGIVSVLVNDEAWPYLLPGVVAMIVMAVNFPTGAAMRPSPFATTAAVGGCGR